MNLRRNSIFSAVGMLVRLAVTILSIPILIRQLGLEQYGIWAVLNAVLGLSALMQMGLEQATTFFVSRVEGPDGAARRGRLLGTSLIMTSLLGLVAAAAVGFGAPLWTRLLFPESPARYTSLLVAIGPLIIVQAWRQWACSSEAGLLRYDLQVLTETVGTIVLYSGLIVVAWFGAGLVGIIGWFTIASMAIVVAHLAVLWRFAYFAPRLYRAWDAREARLLLRFGVVQWVSQFGGTVFSQADRLLVNYYLGPAAAGLYSVATSVAIRINELSSIPIQTIAPAMSKTMSGNDKEGANSIFIHAQRLIGLIVYGLTAALIFGGDFLARFLATDVHADQLAPILRALALCYGIYSLNSAGFFAAIGIGRPSINAIWVLAAGLVSLLLQLLLIPRFGILGAAWANGGYCITLCIGLRVAVALKGTALEWARVLLPALCAIGVAWVSATWSSSLALAGWVSILASLILTTLSIAWVGGRLLWSELIQIPVYWSRLKAGQSVAKHAN